MEPARQCVARMSGARICTITHHYAPLRLITHDYALLRTIMGIQSGGSGSRLGSNMCLIIGPTGVHADVVSHVPSNAFGSKVVQKVVNTAKVLQKVVNTAKVLQKVVNNPCRVIVL